MGSGYFGGFYLGQYSQALEEEAAPAAAPSIPLWRPFRVRRFPKYITEVTDRRMWWYQEPLPTLPVSANARFRGQATLRAHPDVVPIPVVVMPSASQPEWVRIAGDGELFLPSRVQVPEWLPIALQVIELTEEQEEEDLVLF